MNLQQVIADIENRSNRTLAAIERWVATEGRTLAISFEPGGWVVRLFEADAPVRQWQKPTLMDGLAHAAAYCQQADEQPALPGIEA